MLERSEIEIDEVELAKNIKMLKQANEFVNYGTMVSLKDINIEMKVIHELKILVERAAEMGHVDAQFCLARLYREDNELCLKWTQLAAAQNHPVAIANLACYYLLGVKNVQQNLDKAAELFALANASPDSDAKELVVEAVSRQPESGLGFKIKVLEYSALFQEKIAAIKWAGSDKKSFIKELDLFKEECQDRQKFFNSHSKDIEDQIAVIYKLKQALEDKIPELQAYDKEVLLRGKFAPKLKKFEKEFGYLWKPEALVLANKATLP